MNLLQNLAMGLRQAGGVLSPKVQEMTVNQDNIETQLMERRKDMAAQQIIKAAEMGAIDPEAAKIQLQRLGYGGMGVGPGIEAQQRQAAMAKEKAYREAIAGLGANPTQDDLARISATHGSPDKVMESQQRSLDRREQQVQRQQEFAQTLAQKQSEFQERILQFKQAEEGKMERAREANASKETLKQMGIDADERLKTMVIEGRRQMAGLAASMRQPPASQLLDQGDKVLAIGRDNVARPVVDEAGNPIGGKATKISVMGVNESAQLNRVLMGGNQTAKALGNIVNLPITASSGIFGGRSQGKSLFEAGKETLTNTMTKQEVQAYNTLTTGVQRSLAAIESAGLAPSNSLMHMMSGVIMKEGDTNFTKLLKLAETRQVVEAGYEVVLANPRVSDSQKTQAQSALEDIRTHVPFTPLQVMQLNTLQQQNPNATMKDVMANAKTGGAPKAAIDYLKANPGTKDAFKAKYGYLP